MEKWGSEESVSTFKRNPSCFVTAKAAGLLLSVIPHVLCFWADNAQTIRRYALPSQADVTLHQGVYNRKILYTPCLHVHQWCTQGMLNSPNNEISYLKQSLLADSAQRKPENQSYCCYGVNSQAQQ
jgi:hypothetical protein